MTCYNPCMQADDTRSALPQGHGTARERLLEAAAELFARRGHEHVTIREIAAAAGVRHGGVNYHFSSKRDLYLEVLARHAPPGGDIKSGGNPIVLAARSARTPEDAREALKAIIAMLVKRMTAPPTSIAMGLMQQELKKPDGPDDAIYKSVIELENRTIAQLLGILAPSVTDEQELHLRALGIMAQALVFRVAYPVTKRLLAVDTFDEEWVRRITNNIIESSLYGLDEHSR